MKTQYEDKSVLTFVNKKFILANNDPNSPVRIVRQTHKNDSTKVTVYLSNGESFEDTIETLEDLIDISGNKAYRVTLFFDICLSIYKDATSSSIEKALMQFFSFNFEFNNDGNYLPTNQMIKRRVIPLGLFAALIMTGEGDNFRTADGKLQISYYVISPPEHINDIVKDGDESMADSITSWIRRSFSDFTGVSFSGRNYSDCLIDEVDISTTANNAIETCKVKIAHATQKKSVIASNEDEIKNLVTFFGKN